MSASFTSLTKKPCSNMVFFHYVQLAHAGWKQCCYRQPRMNPHHIALLARFLWPHKITLSQPGLQRKQPCNILYLLWTVGSNHQEQRCPDPVVHSTFSTFTSHQKTQHVKNRCQVTQGSANITSGKTWQIMLGIILSTSPHSFLHQKADEKRPLLTLSMNLWQLQKWLCVCCC